MTAVWAGLLSVSWLLALARCVSVRATFDDYCVNAYRLLNTLGCTLLSPMASHWLPPAEAMDSGLLCIGFGIQIAAATSLNMSRQLSGWRSRAATLSPPAIAVSVLALIVLDQSAWSQRQTPFEQLGFAMLGYWLIYLAWEWLGSALALYEMVAGLRAEPGYGERVIRVFGLAIFLAIGLIPFPILANAAMLAAGDRSSLSTWLSTVYPDYRLCLTVSQAILFAIPAAQDLTQRLELDHWSRQRRQLIPLWGDLTSVCPEVVHLAAPTPLVDSPRYRLHRTVVEIRDSMLILSRYADDTPCDLANRVPTGSEHDDILLRALRLARATVAKTRGVTPGNNLAPQRSAARDVLANDLFADADDLIRLARVWPHAKALTVIS